jgi:hypothetical protein
LYTESIRIAHTTLYDKERAILNQNKRKAEALEVTTASPADSNTSSQSSSFSLKKKQKKAALIKISDETVPGSWAMTLSQESEKSTSRLKKEQYCLLLADDILNGKVRRAVENLRIEHLTDAEKHDPTAAKYLYFSKGSDSNPQQKQNVHELFFGDKNDVRRLIELEGKAVNHHLVHYLYQSLFVFIAKALEDKAGTNTLELSYSAQNNVKNESDIKLAMDIANAQYRMFDSNQMDQNTNSCIMDWILLALSPVGNYPVKACISFR